MQQSWRDHVLSLRSSKGSRLRPTYLANLQNLLVYLFRLCLFLVTRCDDTLQKFRKSQHMDSMHKRSVQVCCLRLGLGGTENGWCPKKSIVHRACIRLLFNHAHQVTAGYGCVP